jgi:hypothetical protein
MKILRTVSEDEVISVFLKAEHDSDRFGSELMSAIQSNGLDEKLIIHPNIFNKDENRVRRKVFGEYRGFGLNQGLFEGFPQDISWFRANITNEELSRVLYINWDYWIEVTQGTRSPLTLANRIKNKLIDEDEEVGRFKEVARMFESGKQFDELILVAKDRQSRLVVLEGHARLTAYFLSKRGTPDNLEVIIGFSEEIEAWGNY